jgi:hypothetical protein
MTGETVPDRRDDDAVVEVVAITLSARRFVARTRAHRHLEGHSPPRNDKSCAAPIRRRTMLCALLSGWSRQSRRLAPPIVRSCAAAGFKTAPRLSSARAIAGMTAAGHIGRGQGRSGRGGPVGAL